MWLDFRTRLELKESEILIKWELEGNYKSFYASIIKDAIEDYCYKELYISNCEMSYISNILGGSFTVVVENTNIGNIKELIENILDNIEDIIKNNLIILPRIILKMKRELQGTTTLVVSVKNVLNALP